MAKAWYPVIDYISCKECGTCVAKCPHGVLDTAKSLLLRGQLLTNKIN